MVANNNGLLNRFLISLPSTEPVSISARMEGSRNLRNNNLTSFERLYERIYAKHNTADRVKYGLSQEALDVYIRHMSDSESQAVTATSGHSKDDSSIGVEGVRPFSPPVHGALGDQHSRSVKGPHPHLL